MEHAFYFGTGLYHYFDYFGEQFSSFDLSECWAKGEERDRRSERARPIKPIANKHILNSKQPAAVLKIKRNFSSDGDMIDCKWAVCWSWFVLHSPLALRSTFFMQFSLDFKNSPMEFSALETNKKKTASNLWRQCNCDGNFIKLEFHFMSMKFVAKWEKNTPFCFEVRFCEAFFF